MFINNNSKIKRAGNTNNCFVIIEYSWGFNDQVFVLMECPYEYITKGIRHEYSKSKQ